MYVVCVTVSSSPSRSPHSRPPRSTSPRTPRGTDQHALDFLQTEEDPTRFFLYEAYKRKEDFATHQQTAHYLRWKQLVAEWMAQPRQGIRHTSLFFGDDAPLGSEMAILTITAFPASSSAAAQIARLAELAAPLGAPRPSSPTAAGISERVTAHFPAPEFVRSPPPEGDPPFRTSMPLWPPGAIESCTLVIGLGGGARSSTWPRPPPAPGQRRQCPGLHGSRGEGPEDHPSGIPWIAIPPRRARVPRPPATPSSATWAGAAGGYGGNELQSQLAQRAASPRIALIDPELGVGVPPAVTASSGMDALCQCIEAYTSTGANPMTDALALEGVGRAARSLRRAYAAGGDLDAHTKTWRYRRGLREWR